MSRAEGVPGGVDVGVGSEDAKSPTRSGTGALAETDGATATDAKKQARLARL